jgi:hypothetical protein
VATPINAAVIGEAVNKVSTLLNAQGFITLAVAGFRNPLIRPAPTASGALLVASGTALGVVAIPMEAETLRFNITAEASLALAALAFTSLATGLLVGWDRTPLIAAIMLLAAAALLVFSEIGWAFYVATESKSELVTALLTAAGGVVFFRSFGRLQFLPIESRTDHASPVS